jgi:hypothetical protein
LTPTDFTGIHPISYLFDYAASFFSRSVQTFSPPDRSEHGVTVYTIHNPQPNQVCHDDEPNKSVADLRTGGTRLLPDRVSRHQEFANAAFR